ncbi:hypothetical protein [Agromyces marinus]|nr:hypothetical protein [Agromyces marinus]
MRSAVRRLIRTRSRDAAAIRQLEQQVAELREEIDDLRADSARIAEIYDVVVERLAEPRG